MGDRQYIQSYLHTNDLTPGAAGNMFWVLVYILLVFAGLSVAVICDELAGAQNPGPHAGAPGADARRPAWPAAAHRRRSQTAAQRRHHAGRGGYFCFLGRAVRRCAGSVYSFCCGSVWSHACHHRHEYRDPLYARRFVAERAGHCDGGLGLELALSVDRRAALERADGFLRSRHGIGRGLGHPDDQPQRRLAPELSA